MSPAEKLKLQPKPVGPARTVIGAFQDAPPRTATTARARGGYEHWSILA
jgi:hypothetical protein